MRSASSIVVSRKRSCFSSRARFFLYLAKYFPLASKNGDARSKLCMIAETANLARGSGDVKEWPQVGRGVQPANSGVIWACHLTRGHIIQGRGRGKAHFRCLVGNKQRGVLV